MDGLFCIQDLKQRENEAVRATVKAMDVLFIHEKFMVSAVNFEEIECMVRTNQNNVCADFLQLPPVPNTVPMIANLYDVLQNANVFLLLNVFFMF